MKITDALLGEHGVFYAQFDWLEEALLTEERLECVRHHGIMLAAALVPHARAENELLFAELDEHLGAGMGPVAVMRQEHDEIETGLETVGRATELDSARDLFLDAIRLARSHFEKEERVAFPLAERVLGPTRLEELGEQWSRRRGVVLGTEA